jgi:outer membrane protein OmpA-like peptidoglycan-associated protein
MSRAALSVPARPTVVRCGRPVVTAVFTAGLTVGALLSPLHRPVAAQVSQPSATPVIPVVKGLKIGWAWHGDSVEGDYTPYFLVTQANADVVSGFADAYKNGRDGKKETVNIDTQMSRSTMRTGRIYRQIWISTDPLVMNNTTSMMLSSAVYTDIIKSGSSPLTVVDAPHFDEGAGGAMTMITSLARALMSDSTATGTPYSGTMKRVEPGVTPFAVLINNRLVNLPVIHVAGTLRHEGETYRADYRILADSTLPLVLAADSAELTGAEHQQRGGRVISIDYPDTGMVHRMEDDLAARRPVEIYNIYFDFNSAAITSASDSALQMIGTIMQRHPDWHLTVTGHTDSIGGTGQGNRVLSTHRAEAVRQVLSTKYGVAASRLTTAGAGNSAPLATNSTLEGRARNRRVELLRQ